MATECQPGDPNRDSSGPLFLIVDFLHQADYSCQKAFASAEGLGKIRFLMKIVQTGSSRDEKCIE